MSDGPILLHTCCAPCLSGARIGFQDEGIPFRSYWFNPNIHPLQEHDRRLASFEYYIGSDPFDLFRIDQDGRIEYLNGIAEYRGEGSMVLLDTLDIRSRCDICYFMRLLRTAKEAKDAGFPGFSTTLLLSKYQKHDRIKAVGELISSEMGIEFIYMDLRRYWGRSLDASRRYKLYRQNYCACELSARERGIEVSSESVQDKPEVRVKPCDQYKPEDSDG
jgi:predicted adenine nucleotide alpha hydrolase (AANH) superfamily ATPase